MDDSDIENFDKFVEKHWKSGKDKEMVETGKSATIGSTNKRGRKSKTIEE